MGRGTIRLLTIAAVVMGVLIVGGTATLIVLVARGGPGRAASGAAAAPDAAPAAPAAAPGVAPGVALDEPPGTRIVAASGGADGLVLVLSGGGPDRVVVLDPRSGRIAARAALAR